MFSVRLSAVAFLALLLVASTSMADIPKTIHFQGVLTDDQGELLTGTHSVTFRIYDTESGGTSLWSEPVDVDCENGLFSIILGSTAPIDIDFSQQYWLGVGVTGESEMSPRYKLTSVPYAFWSAASDSSLVSSFSDSARVVGWAHISGMPSGFLDGVDDIGAALSHAHDERYYTESELSSAGTINDTSNPVDWTKLKNVPADFADGIDHIGGSGDGHSLDAADGSPTDVVYVSNDGNVGIGTTGPTQKLDVSGISRFDVGAGSIHLSTPGGWPGMITYAPNGYRRDMVSANDGLYIAASPSSSAPSAVDGIYYSNNGNIGIGTFTPATRLHVWGTMSVGVNDVGYDVDFYGADSGSKLHWDESRMALTVGKTMFADTFSVAIGCSTDAYGKYAFAAGREANAVHNFSAAFGCSTDAIGKCTFAAGKATNAVADYSAAFGRGTDAVGKYTFAAGKATNAVLDYSTAFGCSTDAVGIYSFAVGRRTDAVNKYSVAMGCSTNAVGNYSFAMGARTNAVGDHSVALGCTTQAVGQYSATMGYKTGAYGIGAVATGSNTSAYGDLSTAMGSYTVTTGEKSVAMGRWVTAGPNPLTFAIGSGTGSGTHLVNNIGSSLMVGFNTTTPTLFVGGTNHRVGVGTAVPSEKLDVAGTAEMDGFKMPTGASDGYVLTAGATGTGTWQPAHLMDFHDEGATTIIGSGVTQYDDTQVSLTVPGGGYITLMSKVWLKISHTSGSEDVVSINHSTSAASIGLSYYMSRVKIPSAYPTDTQHDISTAVISTHPVTAGTHTYYLVGKMESGQDANDRFWFAQMTAMYHPDPSVTKATVDEFEKSRNKDG